MATSTKERAADEPATTEATTQPKKVIGRLVRPRAPERNGSPSQPPVALFCHEPPQGYVGGHVHRVAAELARSGRVVHLFVRQPFGVEGVTEHAVGPTEEGDVVEQAREYTKRAANACLQQFAAGQPVEAMAYEWSSAGVLPLLRGLRNVQGVLSLHTLERQRNDVTSPTALAISEIEREAMEAARALLIHDAATAEAARLWMPACAERLVQARPLFVAEEFEADIDPGTIKARYQVGPVDPVILFVGDLDDGYGPDLLLKAMPALLRHHPQARLVIVGDGQLLWPLKVYARYLLLEYAVRLVGDVQGQPLRELIQAADIVAVPSRRSTPWWPIQAAWAAQRPVVLTHDAAPGLIEHEKDGVLVYPSENSIVWGVERVLYDAELRQAIGAAGRAKLDEQFGWKALAAQVEEVLAGVPA